jgi:hypothetical protein
MTCLSVQAVITLLQADAATGRRYWPARGVAGPGEVDATCANAGDRPLFDRVFDIIMFMTGLCRPPVALSSPGLLVGELCPIGPDQHGACYNWVLWHGRLRTSLRPASQV